MAIADLLTVRLQQNSAMVPSVQQLHEYSWERYDVA